MDLDQVHVVIVATFFGFVALAVALLLPVYLFMRREERRGEAWNSELRRQGKLPGQPSGDGGDAALFEGDERA